jgi:hypothetical protein
MRKIAGGARPRSRHPRPMHVAPRLVCSGLAVTLAASCGRAREAAPYVPPPYAPPEALTPPVPASIDTAPGTLPPEVERTLLRIGKSSKAYFVELGSYPTASSDYQPPTDCCSYPGGLCPATAAPWTGGLGELEMASDAAHHFRYSYASRDGKDYVARALGDPECDGTQVMFELWAYTVDRQPAFQIKKWF